MGAQRPGARARELPLDPRARRLARALFGARCAHDRRLAPRAVPVRGATTTASSRPARGAGGVVSALLPLAQRQRRRTSGRRGSRPRSTTTTAPRSRPARASVTGLDLHLLALDPALHRLHYDVDLERDAVVPAPRPLRPRPAARASTAHFREAWDGYVAVNRGVRRRGRRGRRRPASTVLVQDYQLALVPGMVLRQRDPTSRVVALHPHAVLRSQLDPRAARRRGRRRCAASMAAVPSGFHTERWAQRVRGVGARGARARRRVGRRSRRRSGPIPTRWPTLAARPPPRRRPPSSTSASATASSIAAQRPHRALEEHRARLPRVRPAARRPARSGASVSCSSRCSTRRARASPEYLAYRARGRAGRRSASTSGGRPRTGSRSSSTRATTTSAPSPGFARYDVLLVNPVKDGLNLVAKEGPLAQPSATACCASHPKPARTTSCAEAVLPCTRTTSSRARTRCTRALSMPDDERASRARAPVRAGRGAHAADLARRAPQARALSASASASSTTASPAGPSTTTSAARISAGLSVRRHADASPRASSAPVRSSSSERGERGEVAGVVAGERGDRRARRAHELGDRRALVDRHRRAQLHRHPARGGARRVRAAPRSPPPSASPRRPDRVGDASGW